MTRFIDMGLAASCILAVGCVGRASTFQSPDRPISRLESQLPVFATSAPSDTLYVAGDPGPAPAGCTVESAARSLDLFFATLSSGELNRIRATVSASGPDSLRWYSMSGPDTLHVAAGDPDAFTSYWTQRAASSERLQLGAVQLNQWEGTIAHFGPIHGSRRADDFAAGAELFWGKAALDCRTGRVLVASLVSESYRMVEE